ncbi:hypothetical protein POUND7_018268 [Theobroma cacao]
MALTVNAAVSLPSSKSSSLSFKSSITISERMNFNKSVWYSRNVSAGGNVVSIKAQVTTEAPAKVVKVSKKDDEGVVVNKFKPKNPYIGKCLLNTKITGDDAPGETWHMVFSTEGEVPYREGQSIGVTPEGIDKNGKPHKLRLYSIASSALGDFGTSQTIDSQQLARLMPFALGAKTGDQEHLKCFLPCKYEKSPTDSVEDMTNQFNLYPNVMLILLLLKLMESGKICWLYDNTISFIQLATGTGIAPFRSFLWKMFFEKHDDYKFNGLAWLFLGVPTSSSLLYKDKFEKMKEKAPDNFRVDYVESREQTNDKGEKMYIQTRMAQYAEELWELLKKDNTYVYMCGLEGMEKGIDEIMTSLAAKNVATRVKNAKIYHQAAFVLKGLERPKRWLLLAGAGESQSRTLVEQSMARLIRPLRQWPQLQQHHHYCCSRTTLHHFLYTLLPLTISTKTTAPCFSFATSTSFRGKARHRPCGVRLRNTPAPSDLQDGETSDSDSDVKKSRNQKKREARRAVRWGMDLASFSTPQIKRILRVASLEQDVFDALMLVKRLGPDVREGKRRQFNYIGKLLREAEPELMDALIQATKVGDQKTLQALAGSKMQILQEEEEEGDSDDQFEEIQYESSQEYVNIANRWFDGLISKDINITNEVYSELRKLVRRVQTIQEQSQAATEEDKAKIEAAVTSAKKSLTRFLRTLARQLPTEYSFD